MIYYVFILVVNPNSGIKTVPELIAYIKANPGKTSYAFGNSTGQVNGAYFVSAAKLDSLPVPYKSTPPAMTDLIAGQVQYMFVDAASSQGHVKSGRLRAIAVMSDKRSDVTPDLPAVGETVPGFDTVPWAGMFAPAGTPKAVIARLNSEIVKAINKPAIHQRLAEIGLQPAPSTPAELDQLVKDQLAAWGKKIRDAGYSARMKTDTPQTVLLKHYTPPPFLVDTVDLDVEFQSQEVIVTARLALRRNPAAADRHAPLTLDGDELETLAWRSTAVPWMRTAIRSATRC